MDRDEARQRLGALRDEFEATLRDARARLAEPQRDSGGDIALADQHPADAATETAERELDLTRVSMFEGRLKQIQDAFARLDGGTYGRCAICGAAIPDERLRLVPDTPFCVKDAQREQARAQ